MLELLNQEIWLERLIPVVVEVRTPVFGDQSVDATGDRGALQARQPRLLGEHPAGVGHRHEVPLCDLDQSAALLQRPPLAEHRAEHCAG